jgi:WD40 repeat protein
VSGSNDKTVKVWDAESWYNVTTLRGHSGSISSCCWSPDKRCVVSGSHDATLKIWDADAASKIANLTKQSEWYKICSWSPDGRHIFQGAEYKTLRVCDGETWDEIAKPVDYYGLIRACPVAPDDRDIVPGADGKTLEVLDTKSGEVIVTLTGHTHWVNHWCWSRDGRRVVSASEDKTLKVWNAESGVEILNFIAMDSIYTLSIGQFGVAIAAYDGAGKFYILITKNIDIGPPILTPWHSDVDGTYAFGCPFCRKWSEVPESALGTEIDCPKCSERVKLNPFTIDADWRPVAKGWGDDSHTVPVSGKQ